jgi:exopolyphosphatase/guanosine-5'-triphosphate,3'-diphosphate pyrophosphatase
VRGILRGLRATASGPLLAFDIGGGSTEYILARDGRVTRAVSLTLGVVELAERHPFPSRVSVEGFERLRSEVRARLDAELPAEIRGAGVDEIVGTAGTVTTLAALDLDLRAYDAARVQGHGLPRAAIERLRDRLAALTLAERAGLPCLEPGRADLIVPGVAIVLATMDATATATVIVSDWGLREGMMDEVVERLR